MTHDLLFLGLGLILIIKGGDWFVAAAVRIAEFLRMPRVVIGGTLVSLATTTPELVVSVMAGLKGESGLSVGNAMGSVICNIGLIIGVTAVLKQVDVNPRTLRFPLMAMFAFGAALFCMTLDLNLSRAQGAWLLAGGLGYFVWDFARHWRDRRPHDVAEAVAIDAELSESRWAWVETKAGTAVQFLLGAALVVVGSKLLVDGAVGIAARLGVPSLVVGLTVVAIGTSLPELVTAITSSRQAVSDLAVGNVIGANIANLTLIVGTAAILQDVHMERSTQLFNFPVMLGFMAVLGWMLFTNHRITRREGVWLLVAYAHYLIVLTGLAMTGGNER